MITKCVCNHCPGHIEFETKDAGRTITCPHCGIETVLYEAQNTPAAKVPHPALPKNIQAQPPGYIHQNLMPGEVVTGTAHLHWVIYVQIAYAAIMGLIADSFFYPALCGHVGSRGGVIVFLILVVVAPAGFAAMGAIFTMKTAEFAVTNKRVLMKCGFIKRTSVEILLPKVESIMVSQGILGRVLDFGTIIVGGTGGTKDPFHNIAAPLEFRQKLQKEIAKNNDKYL